MNIFQNQTSEEEQKKIIEIRNIFSELLQLEQSRADNSQRVGELSPESLSQIYDLIKLKNTWLEKHKNAKYIEIYAEYQSFKNSVQDIKNIDKPRRGFFQQITIFPFIVAQEVKKNPSAFVEEIKGKLQDLEIPYKKQYEKEKRISSLIDFNNQQNDFYNKIKEAVSGDTVIYDILFSNLQIIKDLKPNQYENVYDTLYKQSMREKNLADETALPVKDIGKESVSLAVKIFTGGILAVLMMMGGSFAANFGITQNNAYRVLYFIYGTLFFPIVFLYTLIVRIYRGPIDWYAFFPLTNIDGTTALTSFLMKPFYWTKDDAYYAKVAAEKLVYESVLSL